MLYLLTSFTQTYCKEVFYLRQGTQISMLTVDMNNQVVEVKTEHVCLVTGKNTFEFVFKFDLNVKRLEAATMTEQRHTTPSQ